MATVTLLGCHALKTTFCFLNIASTLANIITLSQHYIHVYLSVLVYTSA